MTSVAYSQSDIFDAASIFAKTEGLLVAPETAHCLKSAIDKAIECKNKNEEKVIAFNCSGHGLLDLSAYESYKNKKLVDFEPASIEVPSYVPNVK